MTFTPPKRSERKICWANRDAYFKCLDASNIKDPSKDTTSECAKLKEIYQSTCPSVWVQHFNDVRVSEIKKQEYMDKINAQ